MVFKNRALLCPQHPRGVQMVQEKISMKKIREVLRMRYENSLSHSKIANAINIGETTVGEYLIRAKALGIKWPLPSQIDDDMLEELLYPSKPHSSIKRNLPDFHKIHKEYQQKGVTLRLLWEEYTQKYSNTLAYSRFCDLYKKWCLNHKVWMPQQHKFGEEIYVDYSGLTMRVFTSKLQDDYYEAQIFVGVLGASSYTYLEATATQQLTDWIASHQRMWAFFGGVSDLLIPDNLKSGVTQANLYEPSINRTYFEMAQHYGCSVVPARARKPKDKSKVEKAVQDIQNLILGPIRDQHFFSLEELNQTLWSGLKKFNEKPFQKLPGSRRGIYIESEKPALNPLPQTLYEFFQWSKAMVSNNYHVCVEKHYYSVPYRFVRNDVEIRYNERLVEVFCKGKQISIHQRKHTIGQYSTNPQHRPLSHQYQADCCPEKLLERASKIGSNTSEWVDLILKIEDKHQRQKEKLCVGVLNLVKSFGENRLEEACKRALYYKIYTYKSIEAMLKNKQDQRPIPDIAKEENLLPQKHDNIRGPVYFSE